MTRCWHRVGGEGRPERAARGIARAARSVALIAALIGWLALINPVPAAAHIVGTGGSPSNYRTEVTSIQPAAPAVAVTVGLGGEWVRATNRGATTIMVLGYHREPFLRLSQNHVQANQLSGTAAQTVLAAATPVPENPVIEPKWAQLSDGDSVTWVDARIDSSQQSAQPSRSWELPLVVDGQQVTILGTRTLVPPPSPWPWAAALGLLTVAAGAIGWRRDWHQPMAAAAGVGVLAFILHALGTGFAPQQNGPVFGWVGVGLVAGFALVVGTVCMIGVLRRSESAPDRAVTVGAILLVLAATDISVLWNSQLPFAGPSVLDRGLTVIVYAVAVGLIIAGVRLVRVARSVK